MSRVYLDWAAGAPMPVQAANSYAQALTAPGNPASTHMHGQAAADMLERARVGIAVRLGVTPAEVIFTSGATEAINTALQGFYHERRKAGAGPVILVAEGEHEAVHAAATHLAAGHGAKIVFLPLLGDGRINAEVAREIWLQHEPNDIACASFSFASSETGAVNTLSPLAPPAGYEDVPVHVDAVQALSVLPINMGDVPWLSALSVSAHKIQGPPGIGALLLARNANITPLIHGGNQQRFRSGTQQAASAAAFARALETRVTPDGCPHPEQIQHVNALQRKLVAGIREIDASAVLQGPPPGQTRLPGITLFTFPKLRSDTLVMLLDQHGISTSVGSACHAGVAEPSRTLIAMGLNSETALQALRISYGTSTTSAEIDAFLEALPECLETARKAKLTE